MIDQNQFGPVVIAGYGSIGRRHFRNLQALGCREFVFFRTGRGKLPAEELSEWPVVANLDDAWSHKPRLAVIANPTAEHLQVAMAAARAGCDLFIEKPVAASLEGCAELSEVVQRQRLVATIGCQFRFHPLLVRLRRCLAAGDLGTVYWARAEWGEYLPDWHPWEDYRRSYSARADLGGGVVLTLIHPLDYLFWLFGPVRRTHASTGRIAALETPAGEDWAELTLEFESGMAGQIHLDYWQRPAVHRLTVWGERGRAEWDYHAGTLRWELQADASKSPPAVRPLSLGKDQSEGIAIRVERTPDGYERNTMFLDEMRDFLDCVAERRVPAVPLADGIAVLKLALAAKCSAREGQTNA